MIRTIDHTDKKQLKSEILLRTAIIRANEMIITEYENQLCQAAAAGEDKDYVKDFLDDLRTEKRTAESELLTFQNLLHEIGE